MTEAEPFEMFVRDYQNMVFSTAMRLLANEAEAEDIAQEVFLKAYQRFAELRDSPTAGGWLKKVATNLSLNHLSRYRARWSFFSEMRAGASGEEEKEIEYAAPEDLREEVARADCHELVEQALETLPASQRVPLVLFHIEGLRYEEIAAKLNVSLGKVKTDIFRARQALRGKLRTQLRDDAY
jgi:RNA polymerase sigma-70 factor (ECF subfamily)